MRDCRVASANEWQGTAAASVIKDGYGGNGLPNATYVDAIPTAWSSVGQSSLYQNTVVPSCRVCHILRGVGATTGTDIDLISYAKFKGYADQIKFHTIDRGNMPLAKSIMRNFGRRRASTNRWLISCKTRWAVICRSLPCEIARARC